MKILRFDDDRIGVLGKSGVFDISDLITDHAARGPQRSMETLIAGFEHYRAEIEKRIVLMRGRALGDVANENLGISTPSRGITILTNDRRSGAARTMAPSSGAFGLRGKSPKHRFH